MENAPETETRTECGCGCSCSCKKGLIPVIVVLAIAVIAVVAAIFIFSNKALVQYAPEGTDAIAAVNGRGIANAKVFKAFKKTLAYERTAKMAKTEGIDLDQFLQGELCVFADTTEARPTVSTIYRGKGGVAEKIFAAMKKDEQKKFESSKRSFEEAKKLAEEMNEKFSAKAPEFSTDKIGGKEAIVTRHSNGGGEATILIDKNTFQTSFGEGGKLVASPLKAGKANALTKAIDAKALISVAYKVELPENVKAMLDSEDAAQYRDLHAELNIVKLNLYDAGDDLELRLTGEYKSAEAAEKAAKKLDELYKFAKNIGEKVTAEEGAPAEYKEAFAMLNAIKIESKGKQISISLKYSQDKIVKLIDDWDKQEREREREREESRKKMMEERKQMENK